MDRATRKANLKKLQLPSVSGCRQKRKNHQSAESSGATNTAITNYFLTPEKPDHGKQTANVISSKLFPNAPQTSNSCPVTSPSKRSKRTKLDTFIFKDPNNIPESVKKARKSLKDDDLIVPEKKIKKAPKLTTTTKQTKTSKSSKAKKQSTIKSAFLRNEQLFAEIAAQHCAADQFDGDDVQLALAISKSEAEHKGMKGLVNEEPNNDEVNLVDSDIEADAIRQKLKIYGFRTAEREDYNTFAAAFLPKNSSRRPKSKWANKFTALTLRSSENQLKKLQQNIEKLLNNQFRSKPLKDHEKLLPTYKLQSSILKKSKVPENERVLQTLKNFNQPNEFYFVKDLFEISDLPAGHLLKDWNAIQGRDLTPSKENKENNQRLKMMENIYRDLEEYYSACKIDWTLNSEKDIKEINDQRPLKEDNQKQKEDVIDKNNSILQSGENINNDECNKVVVREEGGGRVQADKNGNSCMERIDLLKDTRILQLLPRPKSLDTMQVSSYNICTQATINSTQNNRSISPDLFADSDAETEEIFANAKSKNSEAKTVINEEKEQKSASSLDDLEPSIATYEIFSSDEVKNSLLPEIQKSKAKDQLSMNSSPAKRERVIDLTQDSTKSNDDISQLKSVEEIDLFAETPPLEEEHFTAIHDFPLQSPEAKNTNIQSISNVQQTTKNQLEQTNEESLQQPEEGNNKILDENQKTSSLDFQSTSFLKVTDTSEKDILKAELSGNDTIFQELCNKYLNRELANTSEKNLEKFDSPKSLVEILPTIATPKKRALSFSVKLTPTKLMDSSTSLLKSQSFNDNERYAKIDLTQNEDYVDDDALANIAAEDDDECIVLSDDEINYSIFQANKAKSFHNSGYTQDEDDVLSLTSDTNTNSEEEDIVSSKSAIVEFPSHTENNKEFSHLDLKDKEKSIVKTALSLEKSLSDFEKLILKYTSTNSPEKDEPKFGCSEFGVLEEFSEPLDYIQNVCTPTKVLSEASFLASPTEATAPMKRFSRCQRSSEKFNDFIENVVKPQSPIDSFDKFSEFDEFDHLVCTSPLKSAKSTKVPDGLDQLLTGEISFKEDLPSPEMTTDIKSLEETTTQEIKCNGKTYRVRYTSSPKPDFTKYSDAELLKQLYNFGIKPLKRKQAVKMLEYIYNQTHPIITEGTNEKLEDDAINLEDIERPCTSKKACKPLAAKSRSEMSVSNECDATRNKLNLQDSCGLDMLRYSLDLKAEVSDEDYILQTNVTKKTPQPLLPFHIAWYNLVCSNQELHEKILMYEPIDLQEVYLFLKSLGYRYDPKDLKVFFDRRCIIFRYDLASGAGANNRHVRKNKKQQKL